MADSLGPQTIQGTSEERTWRITCYCDNGTDYSLECHRENILVDASGNTLATNNRNVRVVHRTVSQVSAQADAMQFLQLAKTLCDRWALEDAANPPITI